MSSRPHPHPCCWSHTRSRIHAAARRCFIGPHRLFDPFTRSFMNLVPGQGHFGPDAIPGDARWRRGMQIEHRTHVCHSQIQPITSSNLTLSPSKNGQANPFRSKRLATQWSHWSSLSTRRWSTQRPERTSHRRCAHRVYVVVPRQDGRHSPPSSASSSSPPPPPLGLSCVRVGSWLFGSFSSLCVRECPPFVNNIANGCRLAIHAKHTIRVYV